MPKNKAYLLFIFILLLFVPVNADIIKGDVNNDGIVSVSDYILIRRCVLEVQDLTSDEINRADINSDNEVNLLDYIALRKMILSGSINKDLKHTITFDSTGGSSISNQEVLEGGQVQVPSNPKRHGYTFIEWQLDNSTYDFNSSVVSDIKLVAIWGKLNKTTYYMKTSEIDDVDYTIEPKNSIVNVTYVSENKNIATVNNSEKIMAIGAGNTNIMVQVNNVNIGKIETIIDYSFFETCTKDKKNTKVTVKTDNNRSINIYSCIENQNWLNQGLAITNDKIIYTRTAYQTWCKVGNSYNLSKYGIKGKCNSEDFGVLMTVSGNRIKIYDKETGKIVDNYLDVGGHGQAFDATTNNELYINYFPKLILSSKNGYGSHSTGIAYIKNFVDHKKYLAPNTTIRVLNDGNLSLYKSISIFGTIDYFKEIIDLSKESDAISSLEFAIDEDHDKIAVLDKGPTENGNRALYIYKLNDFKKGIKTLFGKYYLASDTCAYGYSACGQQGIELYGNYLYSVQELELDGLNYESITKIKYKTCSKTDSFDATCKSENLNIPGNIIGTEYSQKKLLGINEIEGVSIYKGKVYVSVMTNMFSDGNRRNILLLLDKF